MKYISFCLLVLSLSSCASLFNGKNKGVTIYVNEPAKMIYNQDTIESENNRFEILAKRSEKDLKFEIITDSVENEYLMPSTHSLTLVNNFYNLGLGLLVDLKNDKQYSYPASIFIDTHEKSSTYKKIGIGNHKNEVFLNFDSPLYTNFYKEIENGDGDNFRLAYGLGVGYYHSPNQYINLVYESHLQLPRYILFSHYGNAYTDVLKLTNNHRFNRFDVGYGMNVTFRGRDEFYDNKRNSKIEYTSFGLSIPIKFRISEIIYLGLEYDPTFYNTGYLNKFEYNHSLGIKLGCQINLHTFRLFSFFGYN
ncbi:hypothetical protein [Ornithobacterium rhinotracheale]|uniref:hypothetical protein n=1 Tax=Ornithobacterium rhinotracheale TaxID=28251 RepID=UPI001FF4893F|nr:hypothetical protein [Ornithobacterium rhinotracheale]MCK0204423.1 hypothetical protein [Ornithobacterium rhinotracheale]